jgi:hypothetical protein
MKSNENQISVTPSSGSFHLGMGISEERSNEIRKRVGELCKDNAGVDDEQAVTTCAIHNEFENGNECAYALAIINMNDDGTCAINPAFVVPETVANSSSSL